MNLEESEDPLGGTEIKQEVDEFDVTPGFENVFVIKEEDTVVKTEPEIDDVRNDLTTYECNRCTFFTLSFDALEDHKRSGSADACRLPSNLEALSCKWCKYQSKNMWLMIKHVSDDHTGMLREHLACYGYRGCTFCRYVTTDAEDLSEHLKTHVRGHKCDKCPSTFFCKRVLADHKKQCQQLKGRNCTEYFKKTKKLKSDGETAKTVYACTQCPLTYQKEAELERHRFYVHTQKEWFECKHCEFRTPFEEVVKKHAAIKHSNPSGEMDLEKKIAAEKYKCNYCAFKTQFAGKYGYHMQSMHNIVEPQAVAPKAPPVERQETDVVLPKVTLRIQQPHYKCPPCNVFLATEELLKEHQENSTKHAELLKAKRNKKNANRRANLKKVKKRFECDECDFKGLEMGDLREHKTKHTGEKVCQCHICGLAFSRLNYLKPHIRRHTGEKPYVCKICDYRAVQIGSLLYHLRRTHKVPNNVKMDTSTDDEDTSTD